MEYAGRLHRLIAAIIDGIIVLVITSILNAIGVMDTNPFDDTEAIAAMDSVIQAIVILAYYVVLTVTLGATLGKMALGMRVVGKDGNQAGVGPVLVREFVIRALGTFAALVLGETIGGLIGFAVFIIIVILVLFDERRQGLHDKIGGTFVVRAPR